MSNEIPSGSYMCAIPTNEDGSAYFPITTGLQGELSIEVKLWLYAKGAETPFAEIKKTECIDAMQPARGNTRTTPYEFMAMALKNLGATSDDAIDEAIMVGLNSAEGIVRFPGTPRPATAEVSYKAGTQGGSFMNVKIMPHREVTDDARQAAIEALKARRAANKPAPNPFLPAPSRGAAVSPPPPFPGR